MYMYHKLILVFSSHSMLHVQIYTRNWKNMQAVACSTTLEEKNTKFSGLFIFKLQKS